MLFLPIYYQMGIIGTDVAAKRLGVSVRRLTAMIRTGIVPAKKIGRSWVLEESEINTVAKKKRPVGRPKNVRR